MTQLNRETIKDKGWAFGAIFSSVSAPNIADSIDSDHQTDSGLFVSVTHDCSIILASLDAEPYIEYLSLEEVHALDGNCTYAKSVRKLHLEICVDDEIKFFELSMGKRGFAPRRAIESSNIERTTFLPEKSLTTLKRWLSNRYSSQAFPDKFNDIIAPLTSGRPKPLIKAFEIEEGALCHSIFISLTPRNEDPKEGEQYELVVALLYEEQSFFSLGEDNINEFSKKISKLFADTGGFSTVEVQGLWDQDVTYADMAKMSRWQFDYISLRKETHELTTEII